MWKSALASACILWLVGGCSDEEHCPDIQQVDRIDDVGDVAVIVELERSCAALPCDAAAADSVTVAFQGDPAACYTPPDDVVVRFNALETDLAGGGLEASGDGPCACYPADAFAPDDPLSAPGEDLTITWDDPAWPEPIVLTLPAASIDHQITLALPSDGTVGPGDVLTVGWTVGTDPSVQLGLLDAAGEVALELAPVASTGSLEVTLPADLAPGAYRLVGFVNTLLCDRATCGATTYISALIDAPVEVAP